MWIFFVYVTPVKKVRRKTKLPNVTPSEMLRGFGVNV